MRAVSIVFFLFLAVAAVLGQAKAVSVKRVTGTIDCKTHTARMTVTAHNGGQEAGSIAIDAFGKDVNRNIKPGLQDLPFDANARWIRGPGRLKTIHLDGSVKESGKDIRVPETDIRLLLPLDVEGIIRANVPLEQDLKRDGGRVVLRLKSKDKYLTDIRIVYTTGPVTLRITKTIAPTPIRANQPVTVTLQVKNLGPKDAAQINLKDDWNPFDFHGQGKGLRAVAATKGNDGRIYWAQTIAKLARGATTTVTYTIKAKRDLRGQYLSPVRATIGDELVGVSNRPRLKR